MLIFAPSHYYQPRLSIAPVGSATLLNDQHGQLASDVADIAQCIHTILSTPHGAQVQQPLFGSSIHQYIDFPVDVARPHLVREITEALRLWEPRIVVDAVTVVLQAAVQGAAALLCTVLWRFVGDDLSLGQSTGFNVKVST